ncbi:MAG TPA: lipase [Gordonia sp. (in: high G+C Gram-positive bacteria)]|uniref:esterase/lipase family protein n=1 Tax=unclassified Gordonia (in: high G+C Gram-positive bacteria) TaxID=2657482 RepID=UPI0025C0D2D9|nr:MULTISPECIES: lipase [unclassified Gordonia (in: high G+C Gram-positive bacteria)]HNP58406.1 lipase [Gordonia sp. (in: high G+C Gram-positive bacteria)]HRC52008.1 lipase [Gordonia sp. (in: high G+C Gram-positive bacteria)]
MMKRLFAVLSGTAIAATGLITAAPAHAAPVTRVILMPGQSVGGMTLGFAMGPMADNLTSRGFPTTVLNLAGKDLRADARRIAAAVDQTRRAHPGDRIALVGHSISGISSRWYLKEMGGTAKVATYIAIGTAQYGSPPSCTADIARENCPGSPFINRLNAGIDTPKPTVYFGIRSTREYATGDLDGRQCRVTPVPIPDIIPNGFDHTAEPLTPAIWDATAASLRGQCKGRWVTTPDGVLNGENQMLPTAPGYKKPN